MGLAEALIAGGIFTVIVAVVFGFSQAFGQDFDPCMVQDNEMFKRQCDKIEIEKIHQELLERAREWNDIHK